MQTILAEWLFVVYRIGVVRPSVDVDVGGMSED